MTGICPKLVLGAILWIASTDAVRAAQGGNGEGNNGNGNGNGGSHFVPDISHETGLGEGVEITLRVKEQARIEVPSIVIFQVDDVTQDTPQAGYATLMAHNVVLATGHRLRIQIAAATATFTDELGHPSYAAAKVSWRHDAVVNGVGINGHLGGANEFTDILSCNPGTLCKTEQLKFTLGADAAQGVAGWHILMGNYRVSAVL